MIDAALSFEVESLLPKQNNGRFGEPRSEVCMLRSPNRPSGGLAVIVMGGAGARLAPCRGLWMGSIRRRPATR